MIRKFTIGVFAAALALLASCNKAEDMSADQGERVTVKYHVSLEDASAITKDGNATPDVSAEYGKGTEIDKVCCLVYTKGEEEENYTLFSSSEVGYIPGSPIEFNPEFFRNQQYRIVFIAYDQEAYVVDGKNAKMTYKDVTKTLIPEQYDAFTYSGDVSFSGADANVTLVRPFSLWKVYTADEDIVTSQTLGAVLKAASVTATINTSYDVLNGKPSDDLHEMTFKREFPADDSQTFKDTEGNDVRYTLISAQYIIPSDNVDAHLMIFAESGDCVSELSIPNVPTDANSKVNIYGRLATSEKTFNITLDFDIKDNDNNTSSLVR